MESNKIIVITGGATGIGLAIVKEFSDSNTVISLDRNQKSIDDLVAKVPKAISIHTDVTDTLQLRKALTQIEEKYGRIDILINNAGIGKALSFEKLSEEEISAVAEAEMKVNYFAPIRLTKMALPLLDKSADPRVVFNTSGLAYTPSATFPTYSATKAALHSFVLTLRHQLKNTKVHVYELLPPAVDTAFSTGIDTPKIKPEQVAKALAKGLESKKFTIHVGQAGALSIISRISPSGAFKMVNPSM